MLLAGALALLQAPSATAAQGDYKPVTCSARAAYAGPMLHAPDRLDRVADASPLSGDLPSATAARLASALDRGLAASPALKSITATVAVPGQGLWTGGRRADGDRAEALFHWASVGKLYTAVAVLQLVEAGELRLDAPLSTWSPDAPNAAAITVQDLLQHTSGLFSASEDAALRKRPRALSAAEELRILRRHGAMACPGERWRYSNSGYALLGQIVSQVDERPYAAVIETRALQPLHLDQTRVLSPDATPPPLVAVPQMPGAPPFDPMAPAAAGAIAASSEDMVRFLHAVLTGPILSPETRQTLLAQPYPMFDPGTYYGLGLMLYDQPKTDPPLYWVGHSAGFPGLSAIVVWSPRDQAYVAVALTGEGSAAAFANALLKSLAADDAAAR